MSPFAARLEEIALLSDEDVVRRVLDGDGWAFELLMRRYNERLYRLARAVAGSDADAEDVLQETYVRAYTKLGQFRFEAPFATWLAKICFRQALRVRRKRASEPSADSEGPAPATATPLSELLSAEVRVHTNVAIDALPLAQRAVITLRLVEGLSTRETAVTLRMSESAVKVNLLRARRAVVASLQRRGIEDLGECFQFGGRRCDRIVSCVLERLRGQVEGF